MSTVTATKTKTYDLAYIAIFAVLIAICSWISIPMTVPFTLQTFGVFMAVGVLGGKRGSLAVLVYILLGAIGVPVFAGFSGGLGILLNNTGGYIIGFLFSALVMWAMESLWEKACYSDSFHGSWPDRLLRNGNYLVYGCIYKNLRSCRTWNRTGLVRNSIYHS